MVAEAPVLLDPISSSGTGVPASLRARAPRALAALAAGLIVGTGLDQLLAPGASFTTHAVVGMSDDLYGGVPASARAASEQASIAAVLSKGVLVRAASALRDKGVAGPEPGFLDRVAVAAGLQTATSASARIEQMLAARIGAARGTTPGTVAIAASDERADGAALLATTVAEAFVTDQDQAAADLRRARDGAAASRMKGLVEAAETARRHLAAFGTVSIDPVQDRAAATEATAAAKARLDAFRAVIASGSPPLGAPAGLPSSIAPLQADYLELKRQLLDVQRTLGERHTTVIGLEDGVRQAAKSLSAEWKRLAQNADADWKRAAETESQLARTALSGDAKTRVATEAARDAVKAADMALARFQAGQTGLVATDQHYRLIAPAAVPTAEAGLPFALRLILDAVAALAAAALALATLAPRRRRRARSEDSDDDRVGLSGAPAEPEAVSAEQAGPIRMPLPPTKASVVKENRVVAPAPGVVATRPGLAKPQRPPKAAKPRLVTQDHPAMAPAAKASPPPPVMPDRLRVLEPAHPVDIADVVAELTLIEPGHASYTLVLVGGSEPAAVATPVVLALARGAAAAGQRVLLIEADRPRPMLAAAVGLGTRPVLVDVLGMLRVVLPDEHAATLFLAPAFPERRRLAAGLAQRHDVAFVDAAADAFDLVIIDVGSPEAAEAEDWSGLADASIRIGRSRARHEEEAFLAATGGTFATFLGTIASAPTPQRAQPGSDRDDPVVPPRKTGAKPVLRRSPDFGAPPVAGAEPAFRRRERRRVAAR